MRILHLSDLHFGKKGDADLWQSQLSHDLKTDLECDRLNAIIVSGDIANFAAREEYKAAEFFFSKVCHEFKVDPSHLVIVPGNHDLNWELSKKSYALQDKDALGKGVKEEDYIPVTAEVIRLRNQRTYKNRFKPFSTFYKNTVGTPYPLDASQQGIVYHLEELKLLILGLNSAWQVDHHFTARAGICSEALSAALDNILNNPAYAGCLKLAVWHHPIHSPYEDRITDYGFMERLAQSGFKVCFHGHLHKTTTDLFRYDHSAGGRRIEIVGAGTFGAPIKEWTPGYPLQYNLLEIAQKQMTVKTRCRIEINGAWKPHAIWTQGPGQDPLPRYTIDLVQ